MRRAFAFACLVLAAAGCSLLTKKSADKGRSIKVNSSVTGTLAETDPALRGNRGRHQVWVMKGKRGQKLNIDLTSSGFDTYLYLRDAEGFLIAQDDDGGDGNNAKIRTILPRTGNYRIIATSFGQNALGDYTLTISEWISPDAPAAGAAASLAMGETKDGLLEPGDEFAGDGPYQDRWTFDLRSGQRARVEMRSSDVDAYVIVLDPDGRTVVTNDDANGRDAAAYLRASRDGSYAVLATTYGDAPRVGSYRVALVEVTGDAPEPGQARPISEATNVDGQLEPGDSASGNGGFIDVYTWTPSRTGSAVIDMVSPGLDTYLTLQDSLGITIATDDDGGEGTNAHLVWPVTQGARYRVLASTYGSNRTGTYRLSVNMQ